MHDWRREWALPSEVLFLNHGSFGACPRRILEVQQGFRERMEADAVRFFVSEAEQLLDASRQALAQFVGCSAQDLALVPNATHAVSAVLRSLELRPGEELLTTDHAYNACRNALDFVAQRSGARVVVARIPFPLRSAEDAVHAVLTAVTPRTRLAMIDHVTSPTALVLPIEQLVAALAQRGVDTLVDGAHAPGMVPLNLQRVAAAYYAANCHKWLCAPKGAGFLYVRRDLQPQIHPAVISHGANSRRSDRSRFLLEFDWTGTADLSPMMCVGPALDFMQSLVSGGWPEIMRRNRELVLEGRTCVARRLGLEPPCPAEMVGSMAALILPASTSDVPRGMQADPLYQRLRGWHGVDAMFARLPEGPGRIVRLSAMLYNRPEDYQRLAEVLAEELACPRD